MPKIRERDFEVNSSLFLKIDSTLLQMFVRLYLFMHDNEDPTENHNLLGY